MLIRWFLMILCFVFSIAPVQSSQLFDYQSAFKCSGVEKFNWYCDEEEQVKIKEEPSSKSEPPQRKSEVKPPELQEFKQIQERLKELLQIAYVNPTDKNIYNYIEYQNSVTNKAAVFTDRWKRIQWLNPELDYSQKFPVAQMAKAVQRGEIQKNREFNLKHLKELGFGIFFFYKSDCPYCHQMLYPLKLLVERTGMDIISIALDGVISDKFPNSLANNGQAENLGVTRTPTIMLINTETKQIQPISTGWVSLQELEKRIYVLTATLPGDNY